MKKLLLIFFLLISIHISAQELGLRFGVASSVSGESNNVALDFQGAIAGLERIHANVSFGDGLGVDAVYHFLHGPISDEALNWYLGAGPSLFIGDEFWLGAAGEIGIEYRFNSVPIVMSLDWRPYFWLFDVTSLRLDGFGLGIRYDFTKN